MSRTRTKIRGLLRRVYLQHGTFPFFSPEAIRNPSAGKIQKWIYLAYEHEGESAMLLALGHLFADKRTQQGSMPFVCTEFKANKLGRYGKDTQAQYSQYLGVIAEDFEDFHVAQVTTKACAEFLRDKFKGKPKTAQKYAALMRKLFKYVISELGIRHDNPLAQLDLSDYETNRCTELPTHDQMQLTRECGMKSKPHSDTGKSIPTASGSMFCCIIDMTFLCWQRAIDVRMLKESQIEDGRIRFTPGKTAKSSSKTVDIAITPQIQAVIDAAQQIKKKSEIISPYLFLTQKGKPYTKSGLFSMWDSARERAGITDSVWFKDLRSLGPTDAAQAQHAHRRNPDALAHTSSKTSEIYGHLE